MVKFTREIDTSKTNTRCQIHYEFVLGQIDIEIQTTGKIQAKYIYTKKYIYWNTRRQHDTMVIREKIMRKSKQNKRRNNIEKTNISMIQLELWKKYYEIMLNEVDTLSMA